VHHETVAYLGFLSWGGDMILSSSPAFKVRGLNLGLKTYAYYIYIRRIGGLIPLTLPPVIYTPLLWNIVFFNIYEHFLDADSGVVLSYKLCTYIVYYVL